MNKTATEPEIMLPKLSEMDQKESFAYCHRCNGGFENDVNTQHPKCPSCGILMMNMEKEAVILSIKQRSEGDPEHKDDYQNLLKKAERYNRR